MVNYNLYSVVSNWINHLDSIQFFPTTLNVKIDWNKRGQTIDGFGVFAGREIPFYESKFRDDIIEYLFSLDKGLGLTIIRGQIYSNFQYKTLSFSKNSTNQLAQNWIFSQAKKRFSVDKIILSSWSPPYDWKTIPGVAFGRVGTSINHLDLNKYEDFSNYLISYLDFFKKNDIDIYAISPQNEPEYPTTYWEGCVWWPRNLAYFINHYLKPKLQANHPHVKLIINELGNWRTSDFYLFIMRLFTDIYKNINIIASHGYSSPYFTKDFEVNYEISPSPWIFNRNLKKPKWITEASSTLSYDGSINFGIDLATSIHKFLEKDVSAYIFWLAMIDKYSNEALLIEDIDKNELIFTKVYYIFGQFTKWIRPNFVRLNLKKQFFNIDVTNQMVSMFINPNTNDFVIVCINPHHTKSSTLKIDFNNAYILSKESLVGYETNKIYNWNYLDVNDFVLENRNSLLILKIPNLTVRTVAGRFVLS